MQEEQKLKINNINKLKITKIKDWAIYFTYDNARYLLHANTYTTLYKRKPLNECGKFELQWMCSKYGYLIPNINYRDKNNKSLRCRPYNQIDLKKFLWDMTWNDFFESDYSQEIEVRKQKIKEIDQDIKKLEIQKQNLRKYRSDVT